MLPHLCRFVSTICRNCIHICEQIIGQTVSVIYLLLFILIFIHDICEVVIMQVLLDFDHWLHLSELLKSAISSKPDVALFLTRSIFHRPVQCT